MINKMACLGFSTKTSRELQQYAMSAIGKGQAISSSHGSYVKWSPGEGIELWVQLDQAGEIVGVSPHFHGSARMRMAITSAIRYVGDSSFDGCFYGWADPINDDDPESGQYPLVFDAPDFDLHDALIIPSVCNVQLTAFAVEVQAYQNFSEYAESQQDEDEFAVESFIPAGLFTIEGEPRERPQAYAIITGQILDTKRLTNPITDNQFCWARVQTLGGEVDLISESENIDGEMIQSGIISGSFWLTGRIV